MMIIDGFILNARCIVIPQELQKHAWDQLQSSLMGIKNMRLLACLSIYWIGINVAIKKHIKSAQYVFNFSRCSLKRDGATMESCCADKYSLYTRNDLYIVDYHSRFPVRRRLIIRQPDTGLYIIFFSKYGLHKKIMSDTSGNFVSQKFKEFCKY